MSEIIPNLWSELAREGGLSERRCGECTGPFASKLAPTDVGMYSIPVGAHEHREAAISDSGIFHPNCARSGKSGPILVQVRAAAFTANLSISSRVSLFPPPEPR